MRRVFPKIGHRLLLWLQERFWRMCILPGTLVALLMTLFATLNLTQSANLPSLFRTFLTTFAIVCAIGLLLLLLWGLWSLLPLPFSARQRRLADLLWAIFGVFASMALASWLVSQFLDLSWKIWTAQLLLLDLLATAVVTGLLLVYAQMRHRLECTVDQLHEKEVCEQRLLRLKSQAELASLQARTNPHFLFNSLNSIASLISIDPCKAEAAVEKLSRLLRFSLRSSERRHVQLLEEFEIVRTYLELEKIRLGGRLTYEIRITGDISQIRLPGMLLQPLVENAIQHGLSSKLNGGRLYIQASITDGCCHIMVQDNGAGWPPPVRDKHTHGGMDNILERLNLYFNGNCTLETYNREGAVVEISFPVEGSCCVP
ncbi:MAG TPA: histidine kinase [Fibrobacteraceae bacterium]|nr:histidine kinase [Fibrobacteraceae bacterium]